MKQKSHSKIFLGISVLLLLLTTFVVQLFLLTITNYLNIPNNVIPFFIRIIIFFVAGYIVSSNFTKPVIPSLVLSALLTLGIYFLSILVIFLFIPSSTEIQEFNPQAQLQHIEEYVLLEKAVRWRAALHIANTLPATLGTNILITQLAIAIFSRRKRSNTHA